VRTGLLLTFAIGIVASGAIPGSAVPLGYGLVWADEFEGSQLDTSRWEHRFPGPRRDGVNVADAVSVGGGLLTITTYTESGTHFTGMIGTEGLFEQAYGYWEASIDFNDSAGMWSAFWLQSPTNGNPIGDPGAAGVEIDIVEHHSEIAGIDTSGNALHMLFWDGYGSEGSSRVGVSPDLGLGDGFHTYGLLWTPTGYEFFVDDQLTASYDGPVSMRPEYAILSSEVEEGAAGSVPGGSYGTLAESQTTMVVDYVRIYAVPEPGTGVLMLLGLVALGGAACQRKGASS
jgi:beta-glucanase (GH16 family)